MLTEGGMLRDWAKRSGATEADLSILFGGGDFEVGDNDETNPTIIPLYDDFDIEEEFANPNGTMEANVMLDDDLVQDYQIFDGRDKEIKYKLYTSQSMKVFEKVAEGHDAIMIAGTGYGKSMIFGLLVIAAALSGKGGVFRKRLIAMNVDEGHVIEEWKDAFRKDYGELGMLRILAGDEIPWVSLMGTCSTKTFETIYTALGMGGA
ncbi:hypothetical protein BDQ17DRAFT_1435027 [Cyathus striatus]|nr:hypothetical protein BDQ17DRAFT_1435027 [Cyathus striatus]